MSGLQFIEKLVKTGTVRTSDGTSLPLHSETSLKQCEFIQQQIREIHAKTTLEIGLAYGLSAIAICDAVGGMPGAMHHVIDPYQNTDSWHGIGLENLKRSGQSGRYQFYQQTAEECLPQLAAGRLGIDLAYIDAGKRLDDTLVYSTYVMSMLRVGGRVIYDDAGFPGVRQALRYLSQDMRFRVVAVHQKDSVSVARYITEKLTSLIPCRDRIFAGELVTSSRSLNVAAQCVVIEKINDKEPDWKWHPAHV